MEKDSLSNNSELNNNFKKWEETLKNIPDPTVGEDDGKSEFYISEITDETFNRIYGKSFKEDCILPREDLRLLHVLHTDLNGEIQKGEMIVNHHIAKTVLDVFRKLHEAGYPIERMQLIDEYQNEETGTYADDEASMTDNNASSFNFRFISGTKRVSKHGLGLAVDINPLYNPYHKWIGDKEIIEPAAGASYLDREADFPCKIDHDDLAFKLFTEAGFEWGGDWEDRKDWQHFEIPAEKIKEWYPDVEL